MLRKAHKVNSMRVGRGYPLEQYRPYLFAFSVGAINLKPRGRVTIGPLASKSMSRSLAPMDAAGALAPLETNDSPNARQFHH